MKISIVVPAYNEEKLIGRALGYIESAAAAFRRRRWEVEVIVCDNNSTDRTAEVAKGAGAQVVFEPMNQISRARNRGAAAASGNWLVFIDADSFPGEPLFDAIAAAIEDGRVIGGGATIRLDRPGLVARVLTSFWNAISRSLRWAAGSCVFCETSVFWQLGGFSQDLFASEEIEFSGRLKCAAKAAGKQVTILHRHPLTSSGRKIHLCAPTEYGRLLWQVLRTRGGSLRRRDLLGIWYDGRR